MHLEEQHKFKPLDELCPREIKVIFDTRADYDFFESLKYEINKNATIFYDKQHKILNSCNKEIETIKKAHALFPPFFVILSKTAKKQIEELDAQWYIQHKALEQEYKNCYRIPELIVGSYFLTDWIMPPYPDTNYGMEWTYRTNEAVPTHTDEYIYLYNNNFLNHLCCGVGQYKSIIRRGEPLTTNPVLL